jgi:hypothetical protein
VIFGGTIFVTDRYRCSTVSGTLETDGNMHSFSSDTESVLFLFTTTVVNEFSRTRETLFGYLTFYISLASHLLARVGFSPRQPLGPSKCIEMFCATTIQRIHVHLPLPSAITYLLHIAMADRKAMDLEGSLS